MSRAVITGVGAVSAFGVGLPALLQGLRTGQSAVGPIRSFDASGLPTQVAGEVGVVASAATWAPILVYRPELVTLSGDGTGGLAVSAPEKT